MAIWDPKEICMQITMKNSASSERWKVFVWRDTVDARDVGRPDCCCILSLAGLGWMN